MQQIKRHIKHFHTDKRSTEDVAARTVSTNNCLDSHQFNECFLDNMDTTFITNDNNIGDEQATAEQDLFEWKEVVNWHQLGFSSVPSQRYFEQCYITKSTLAGAEYLVKKSLLGRELTAMDFATRMQLPDGHAILQMTLARLCFSISAKQRDLLGSILDGCYKIGAEDGYSCAINMVTEGFDSWCDAKGIVAAKFGFGKLFIKREIAKCFEHHYIVKGAYQWSTKIPRSGNDIKAQIYGGPNSIVENLPIPPISTDIPGHSYVSIVDCIRDLLGHQDISSIELIPEVMLNHLPDRVNFPSNSRRGQQIILQIRHHQNHEKAVVSFIYIWSDDVEPNRSKGNRGSVWLLTATIATPKDHSHRMDNTYPIAIGRKNDNHEPVIQRLEEDMKSLRTGCVDPFYVGKQQKKLDIGFEIFAALQDQPERRSFNGLRHGNGTYSARFGVSANHRALYPVLKSCTACLHTMETRSTAEKRTLAVPTCNSCLNWDVLRCQTNLSLVTPAKDYPLLSENGGDDIYYRTSPVCRLIQTPDGQRIRPFKITYESLCLALDLAHDAYCIHGWTEASTKAYLQVECYDDHTIDNLLEHAANSLSLQAARAQPEKYAALLADAEYYPDKYIKMKRPVAWTRETILLTLHPDVIMHLIGLGVIKTTTAKSKDWMKAQNKYASFKRHAGTSLDALSLMNISWINIMPYASDKPGGTGDKLGGWVSENFFGFCRVMPWFYQNIEEAVQFNDNIPPDGLAPKKYLKKHNQYWLKVRGLDDSGSAELLRDRVAEYMVINGDKRG